MAHFSSVSNWARSIADCCNFGDLRLQERLVQMMTRFAQKPIDSIPQCFEDAHQAKGAYRFVENNLVMYAS
ncbi:MAG: hypothetical protein IH795_08605 [Bacteroidetes bacterium]|nr:hypothetical protein [Bacteroidota bacterium]